MECRSSSGDSQQSKGSLTESRRPSSQNCMNLASGTAGLASDYCARLRQSRKRPARSPNVSVSSRDSGGHVWKMPRRLSRSDSTGQIFSDRFISSRASVEDDSFLSSEDNGIDSHNTCCFSQTISPGRFLSQSIRLVGSKPAR
eukprot:1083576_1